MITGFQLDTSTKPVPLGVRVILTLSSPGEESFTFAISAGGVFQNYTHQPTPPKPNPNDEIWVERTPSSKTHRFIIHTPGNQKILIGDFPIKISFEVIAERNIVNGWMTTNKVLIVLENNDYKIFQAREFVLKNKKPAKVQFSEGETKRKQLPESKSNNLNEKDVKATKLVDPESHSDKPSIPDQSRNDLIQPVFEIPAQNQVTEILQETKTQKSKTPKQRNKLAFAIKTVTSILLLIVGVFTFTPLSFVPVDQPENEKSKVVIAWPIAEPSIGDIVVSELGDLNGNTSYYLGRIENKSKSAYLLQNGENFVQVESNQIKGRVIVSIPFLGIIF